jgi:hypothetical protein
MGGSCSTHGRETRNVLQFWLETPKERDQSEDLGLEGWRMWIGFIWFRTGTDRLL